MVRQMACSAQSRQFNKRVGSQEGVHNTRAHARGKPQLAFVWAHSKFPADGRLSAGKASVAPTAASSPPMHAACRPAAPGWRHFSAAQTPFSLVRQRTAFQLSRPRASGMSGMGHEDAFPPPRLSGRCRFSQGTFAGTRGNGENAPKPALHVTTLEPQESTEAVRKPRRSICA
jgi:hypothetical protein